MDIYEENVLQQIKRYERKIEMFTPIENWSKQMQQKVDSYIPKKVHESIAVALEKAVKSFLSGIEIHAPKQGQQENIHNHIKDTLSHAKQCVQDYMKIATIEGAGTGFGGFIASGIDFPALISIKLKMLQDLLALYGYSLSQFHERLYTIKIMQLEFSGKKQKIVIWQELKSWSSFQTEDQDAPSWGTFNWEQFYMEYKQSIELIKLLQIIPGFGAIVGAYANYTFLEKLGRTAILCLQMRHIQEKYGSIVPLDDK